MKNLKSNDDDNIKNAAIVVLIDGIVQYDDSYEDEICDFDNNFDFDDILYDLKDSLMEYINKQGLPLCEYLTMDDLRSFLTE
jgi:hypothetical protein